MHWMHLPICIGIKRGTVTQWHGPGTVDADAHPELRHYCIEIPDMPAALAVHVPAEYWEEKLREKVRQHPFVKLALEEQSEIASLERQWSLPS